MSIVGRMLSNWLIQLENQESNPQKEYEEKIDQVVSDLGSGRLNTEGISLILLRYVVNGLQAGFGGICEFREDGGHKLLTSVGIEDEVAEKLTSAKKESLFIEKNGKLDITELGRSYFDTYDNKVTSFYFKGENHSGFFFFEHTEKSSGFESAGIFEALSNALSLLLDYRFDNYNFSDYLADTYYKMLRALERSREKTKYHTPRMMAYVQRFGMFFGLEEDEMQIIVKTAKLHDIGYVGAMSIESGKSIGGEISHPIIGANMVEQLSIEKDVIEGIKTHHEWVNGNGSPAGLETESIPWTGKIINLFEYVVDFVETNAGDDSRTGEEWMEILVKGLMERADVEFDMVLVPTAVQLLQTLGWEECLKLGTEE